MIIIIILFNLKQPFVLLLDLELLLLLLLLFFKFFNDLADITGPVIYLKFLDHIEIKEIELLLCLLLIKELF